MRMSTNDATLRDRHGCVAAPDESGAVTRRDALHGFGAAAALALAPRVASAAESIPSADAAARLRALIAASDAAATRLDPTPRSAAVRRRGDPVFVDPLGERWYSTAQANAERDVAGLRAIDPATLGAVDRIAYEVFEFRALRELDRFRSGYWRVRRFAPLNASFGLHVELPDYVSGAGATFATPADYDAGLERLAGFAKHLDSLRTRTRDGLAAGYAQPKRIVEQVVAQCDAFLAQPVEQGPFWSAIARLPESFDAATRERYRRAYRRSIERDVLPAYVRLRDWLRDSYLPRANDAPGLWAMKDGESVYANELAYHTTTSQAADAVHAVGLAEVARIRDAMEAVRGELRYSGTLSELFEYVRTDPQFYCRTPDELLGRFREIEARIWQGIPKLFARRPKAPFEVRALPSIGGQRGTGYYRPGPADGVTPGVLWFNMAMLGTRPIPTLETLTLHEGIPGHHFQITLALEDSTLPEILRFGGLTAYSEGWGLYAESLGPELGMFVDPWQRFGHLDMEMLRAVRLVVDTGLHAKQWSRQQAIDYMLANTSMAPRDVAVEIDRYISYPGQACAYKAGELKLQELRRRAAARFGSRFDVRDFHSCVLDTGALPLAVLDRKVDRWLASAT
jgi:uncharacterized protein (DUF885 family)